MDAPALHAALALTGTVAALSTARLVGGRLLLRWRLATRRRRASEGEREAERLLGRAGFRVLDRQSHGTLTYRSNGAPHAVDVRADLIVARSGRRYVAEVKTGEVAPRLATVATRRQLLEYAHAFDVDGVLLVDPEASRITEVTFPARRSARPLVRPLLVLAAGAVMGAVAAMAWVGT